MTPEITECIQATIRQFQPEGGRPAELLGQVLEALTSMAYHQGRLAGAYEAQSVYESAVAIQKAKT